MDFGTWELEDLSVPLIATAIHAGHSLRPEVEDAMVLAETDRLREEDPFTERFAQVVPNRFIARRSRFEVDLNRPRDKAVYLEPSDAWGLTVWARPPDESLLQESLRLYDDFYVEFRRVLNELRTRHGAFVVLDMHSYNHRRDGAEARAGDGAANPDVNVGTSDLDLDRWGPLVDRFMTEVSELSGGLDARTNVRFTGGHLIQWVQQMFPDSNCSLAIEFKKIFMDEWTGELDEPKLDVLVAAFEGSLAGILAELKAVVE